MDLIIIHDSEIKYFEALKEIENEKKIKIATFYLHFIKFFFKGLIRRNLKMIIKSIFSFIFYLNSFLIKNKIILMGIAPYDFRLIFWVHLLNKNKVIFHNSWPYWTENDYPEKVKFGKNFTLKTWEKFICHKNLYIVNILEKAKFEIIKKYNKDKDKIFIIPHCYNPYYFYLNNDKHNEIKILYVGRFVREKGLEYLRDIIENFKNVKFGIIGEGKDKYILQNVLKKQNVLYYGYIGNKKRLGEIMREYDILLLPSYKTNNWEEVFGIVLIEAMACGLVCISTDCIGPLHIVKDMENGIIVKQKDLRMLIEKIKLVMGKNDLREKIKEKALKSIEFYKIENVKRLWLDVINKISNGEFNAIN